MTKKWVLAGTLFSPLLALGLSTGAVQSQSTGLPPLTELGQYAVGVKTMQFTDPTRDNWTLETYVWFPADPSIARQFREGSPLHIGAVPDKSAAPYPLIIYSHGWNTGPTDFSQVVEHLASHGYVVAAPQHHDTRPLHFELVDRPLDILTVLNGLAVVNDRDLEDMINTDNVGLIGYSVGAETVLQMLGLLRDPVHYTTWCTEHSDLTSWDCVRPEDVGQWPFQEIAAYRSQLGLENMSDGQWAPFGDERIHAVLAIAAPDFPLTTEAMLAAVTTPTMILHGTRDPGADYQGNAVRTFSGLGTEDRFLVTVIDGVHDTFVVRPELEQHFASAFFGHYIKGAQNFADYLTAEHLPVWNNLQLYWGAYPPN